MRKTLLGRLVGLCAAKAGVLNFTKGLYVELQPYGVRATCIIPASASTGFQKNAGIDEVVQSLTVEDIANAVFYATKSARARLSRNDGMGHGAGGSAAIMNSINSFNEIVDYI